MSYAGTRLCPMCNRPRSEHVLTAERIFCPENPGVPDDGIGKPAAEEAPLGDTATIEERMLRTYPWLHTYVRHRESLERRIAAQWALLVDLREKLSLLDEAKTLPEYKRLIELEPP